MGGHFDANTRLRRGFFHPLKYIKIHWNVSEKQQQKIDLFNLFHYSTSVTSENVTNSALLSNGAITAINWFCKWVSNA